MNDHQDDPSAHPLREDTAEFDYFVAEQALESGEDLKHGTHHLAQLLSFDPGRAEWLELAQGYLAATADRLDALIPTEPRYATTEALRAYAWNAQGRTGEALELLITVTNAMDDLRYLDAWVLDWLEPEGMFEALPDHVALRLLGEVLNRVPECHKASFQGQAKMRRWADLAQRWNSAPHFEDEDDLPTMIKAGILRKAGRFDAALDVVGDIGQAATVNRLCAIGLILRRQDRPEDAEAAFAKAVALDPEEPSTLLEVGDTWFEREEWQKALVWYEKLLRQIPDHPWALASQAFCKWRLGGDEQHWDALIEMAHERNPRAHQLWYENTIALPEPGDSLAHILRRFRERPEAAPSTPLEVSLSHLEAPSNLLALRMELRRRDLPEQTTLTILQIPQPDPRRSYVEVDHPLWRYEGNDAFPTLPPPAAEVATAIVELACKPFDPFLNWDQASHVAAALGPERVVDLLAVMTHPPALPDEERDPLEWIPRVQFSAGQVLAQIDDGWEGSRRRSALLSALFGPSDWTTVAAIRALALLASREPALSWPIHQHFEQLESYLPDSGYCCWEYTLYLNWRLVPCLTEVERENLEAKLDELDAENDAEDEAAQTPTRH